MSQCSEQSGKVCECDRRHVSDSLPTLRICVGLYWQVSLCLLLGAVFIDLLSQPVPCSNHPFGNL